MSLIIRPGIFATSLDPLIGQAYGWSLDNNLLPFNNGVSLSANYTPRFINSSIDTDSSALIFELAVDGTRDITSTDASTLSIFEDAFTYSAWFACLDTPTYQIDNIINVYGGGTMKWFLQIYTKVQAKINVVGGYKTVDGNLGHASGTNMISVTWDKQYFKLYENGSLVDSVLANTNYTEASPCNILYMTSKNSLTQWNSKSTWEKIRIYPWALTEAEIYKLYSYKI